MGITLESLPITRGHFRFSAHDDQIYECPGLDLCREGKTCACAGSSAAALTGHDTSAATGALAVTAGDALCAGHSWGPFCMLCEDGYYRKGSSVGAGGTGCLSCDDDGDVVAATMTILVFLLTAILALFVCGRRAMEAARPVLRAVGLDVVFTRITAGAPKGSYFWWRLAGRSLRTVNLSTDVETPVPPPHPETTVTQLQSWFECVF